MSVSPTIPATYFTERAGVLAVASQLNSMGLVWRETPNADVGIDGQIEYVDRDGRASGRLIAAQIKSGKSYVKRQGSEIIYQPADKHRDYWARFPVPVLLFVHDPDDGRVYWTDARQQLMLPHSRGTVRLPMARCLSDASPLGLFGAYGPDLRPTTPIEALKALASLRTVTETQATALHVFSAGLTDMSTKLFFDISLLYEVVESLGGEILRSDELHPFCDAYVALLFRYGLTRYDYADYLVDLYHDVQPRFLVRLSETGIAARDLLYELSKDDMPPHIGLTQERIVEVRPRPSDQFRFEAMQRIIDAKILKGAS